MGRLNHPDTGLPLRLSQLQMKLLHLGPMDLWFVVVFRMVTIIEPKNVIPFGITADSPGQGHIGISAIVEEIAIQIGQAMPEIVERQIKQHEFPVQEKPEKTKASPGRDFKHAKVRAERKPAFQLSEDNVRIVAKVA